MTNIQKAFEYFIEAHMQGEEKAACIAREADLAVSRVTPEERDAGPFQTYGMWEDICAAAWIAEAD